MRIVVYPRGISFPEGKFEGGGVFQHTLLIRVLTHLLGKYLNKNQLALRYIRPIYP
jgi:hypothetical protein